MNNKTLGKNFEKDMALYLALSGYWVSPFPR